MAVGKDDSLCIRFRGSQESVASVLTRSEMYMLEALVKVDRFPQTYAEQEARAGGRRTRQPVITHLLDLHLLDDTYAGVTRTLLSNCNSWSFNTFNLDVSTGGRSLSYLLVHLFQEYGFVKHFQLDIVKVWHCFNLMESAYHRHNPYHNSVHAADVTQAMHCFLQENKFAAHLTPLEAMSSVIAAVAHDLDHPGVTQAFLVATSNHLVNLYHNSSVLENHHWRTAISCLSESGIFNHLERDVWLDIQRQIKSLILATDITRQKEFLAKFKSYLSSECLDMENTQYRHFALQIALKCADLCNPCRPWAISQRWSYQVCQEFYRQGAYERQLKLPLTPTFDCSRTKVAKIQADFFEFVVSPLFETWDHFLNTPLSNKLLENLHHNYSQWQKRMLIMQEAESQSQIESLDTPQITVETCSDSLENNIISEGLESQSTGLGVVIKQHRSKSDSGLTPSLVPPKIHMETYSTEELHPSTTLLSLSSITNTVQLRKVYAATKVESHLICPTVFQPILSSLKPKEPDDSANSSAQEDFSDLVSTVETTVETATETATETNNAQSSVILTCTDGCGTPSPPEKSIMLEAGHGKQRSQSLINDSEVVKYYSQILGIRRASDTGPTSHKFSTAQKCAPINLNTSSFTEIQHNEQLPSVCDESVQSFSTSYKNVDCESDKKYLNVCESKLCSESCVCESTEPYNKTPSWCWHISRSFSEERPIRPSQDFDSPLPSWQGSSSSLAFNGRSGRRSSAPVAVSTFLDMCGSHLSSVGEIDSKSQKGDCEGTAASGRRWSVPTQTISGVHFTHITSNIDKNDCILVHSPRRSSCGLIENLRTISAIESVNTHKDISCTSKPNDFNSDNCESQCAKEKETDIHKINYFANSDSVLPFFSSLHSSPVQRRSSLPTDIPIAIMCHVSSPTHLQSKVSGDQFLLSKDQPKTSNQPSLLIDCAHKHESPSDLLSVLIGPPGMLNSMHGIVSGQTICELPCMAQETSRRRSGGLEMLSGVWKSRTSDVIIGVSMASKLKLRTQLLQEWASWRTEEGNVKPTESANLSISVFDQQKMYQQRRGSVPLNISLLSLSSGK